MSEPKPAMTVGHLLKVLSHTQRDEHEVKVILALPSIGPRASSDIVSAGFGFDWDKGLLLTPRERLVPKTDKQDIFEAANDLLMFIATEGLTKKRNTYEHRTAQRILLRYGYTEEQLKKYVKLFHRDKEIVRDINKEARE